MTHRKQTIAGLILSAILAGVGSAQAVPPDPKGRSVDAASPNPPPADARESPAQLRHSTVGGTSGTLRIDSHGIEFEPIKGASTHWSFTQIESLDLQKHRVILVGYDNRKWPLPGTRRFDLRLKSEITATAAASLTANMVRPARNGVPDLDSPADTVIAVSAKQVLRRKQWPSSHSPARDRLGYRAARTEPELALAGSPDSIQSRSLPSACLWIQGHLCVRSQGDALP